MISRRRFITLSATAAAAALTPFPLAHAAPPVRWSGAAMGAEASLTIHGLDRAQAERLIARAIAEIERLEQIFSLYRADSAVSRLNRSGQLPGPPPELVALLSTVDAVHQATSGAFDPTVQPLWRLLAATRGRPQPADLRRTRGLIGWPDVEVSPERIGFRREGMAITLNGIAQGYATDRIADLFRREGLAHVLVSVGEIAAIGDRSPGVPWRVGIAERGDAAAEEEVALTDRAIATTAPRATAFDRDGRIGHLIEPRTGAAAGCYRRLSVIHPSATVADGLSTGLALLPPAALGNALEQFAESRVVAVTRSGVRVAVPKYFRQTNSGQR